MQRRKERYASVTIPRAAQLMEVVVCVPLFVVLLYAVQINAYLASHVHLLSRQRCVAASRACGCVRYARLWGWGRYVVHEEMVMKRDTLSKDGYKALELAFRHAWHWHAAALFPYRLTRRPVPVRRLISDVEHMLTISDIRVNVLGVPVTQVSVP